MWETVRTKIIERDNFTCQQCHTFNPSLGTVQINEGPWFELHEYKYGSNCYYWHRRNTENLSIPPIDLNISFSQQLILPVLQVHHLYYQEGKEMWEYSDDALITLCKKCHAVLHKKEFIPLLDQFGKEISKRLYVPNDIGHGRVHGFQPWHFLKKDKMSEDYEIAAAEASLDVFIDADDDAETEIQFARDAYDTFMKTYFPSYFKAE